jgi:hypothetical protein
MSRTLARVGFQIPRRSIEVAHNGVELMSKECNEPSIFNDPNGNQIACKERPLAYVK